MQLMPSPLVLKVVLALVPISIAPACVFGQLIVDCSGNTPGAYTSINAALPYLADWTTVQVSGTCQESVWIGGVNNVTIGAAPGQTATLQGTLGITASHNVTIQNLNVSNSSPGATGIAIMNGSSVELDNCTSSNNGGSGLSVNDSIVTVPNGGAFNNNGNGGIQVDGASDLSLSSWFGPGPITVSNNVGDGIYLEDGLLFADGGVTISNNHPGSAYNAIHSDGAGYGINVWGHGRGFVLASWSNDTISGNQAGGVAVHEGSEFVLGSTPANPSVPTSVIVDNNGPVGVSVGLGSQVSLWSGVQITNHTDAGVDVYANSQAIIDGAELQGGTFQIANNGSGPGPNDLTRAGVRVDGNSEAYVRGGQISQNRGPGILVLANSSVDLSGTALNSNAGGAVVCDSSAWLVTDPAATPLGADQAHRCRVPNDFGPVRRPFQVPPFLDIDRIKAQAQQQGRF